VKLSELKELAIEDLERSGLDSKDFKKMGLVVCDVTTASSVLNSSFCEDGYVLPYFDVNGKQTESIRFRFLKELLGKNKKPTKYSQPKGTEPRLYFSPNIKWQKILNDVDTPLIFTEGEKKAYKACKEGIPTIGLGGVWSFKSKKLQKELIDDFNHIVLKDRTIILCFDNDSRSNEEVMKALRAFAKTLYNNGAMVFNKNLPFNPYQKIGLDDYLLTHSKKDFYALENEKFKNITEIDELNSEVAYVEKVCKFYVFKSQMFVSDVVLKNTVFSNRLMMDGDRQVNIAEQWLKSPNRRTHTKLTYKPGEPNITELNELNLWKGWGCVPEKGNITVFKNAIKKLFDNDKDLIKWFMDWVAYPIQNPGVKMLSGVLLQSIEQGTGKSSIGMCIGAMYGDNYGLIDDRRLHGNFNEWANNKQFILGDEVSGKDKRADSDSIKNLITRPTITIDRKFQPTYDVPDCINYLFTSNHPNALNLEPDDRRFFIHRIKPGNGLTYKQGKALEKFRLGKGTTHLLHYFIHEHKISENFEHSARPPMTHAKHELIDASLTDIERFCVDIRDNPDFALTVGNGGMIDRDLFTVTQIIDIYEGRMNPSCRPSGTAMGNALNKIFSHSNLKAVRTRSQGVQRLRALRNIDKWNAASSKEKADHFDKSKIALKSIKNKKGKFK